jgi:hypothetical protein
MARKNSDTPPAKPAKKPRWYRQLWQAYTMTREVDPAVLWWMLGSFFGTVAVTAIVGLLTKNLFFWLFTGVLFGVLLATVVLARRAEKAAYARLDGQPGAAMAALGTIRRGWEFDTEPVAMDPRTKDLVFRGIGRPGILLVGEGPAGRIDRLLESERKRTARVLPTVPITLMQVGTGKDQIELRLLPRKVQRLKPTLTKQEVVEVSKRMRALGAMRLPIPKGVDPMRARPDRKGQRGR